MAVFMELEMQIAPDQYDAVDAALDPSGDPPDGLIAHSARFDGDTLKMCIPDRPDSTRPDEMKANGKDRIAVVTFKRMKEEKKGDKKDK